MMGRAALAVVVAVVVAGCGSNHNVGDQSLLNFKDQTQQRLGQRTPAPSAKPGVTPGAQRQAVGGTPAPVVRTTPPPVSQLVVVKINSDAAGSAFEPTVVEVKPGARVQWVNKDTVKRSVVSDKQGLFASGPLAPGASWTYTVKTTGTFNYHDGTRPYAVGQIVVRG